MKKTKHDWNALEDYLNVHAAVIGQYQKYMTRPTDYSHNWLNEEYLELSASFTITTHLGNAIKISIEKDVEIKTLTPPRGKRIGRRLARLDAYTYVAYQVGKGCLIRYCSPHDQLFDTSVDHHEFHHKHDYSSGREIISNMGTDWPHVDEFLEEVMSTL